VGKHAALPLPGCRVSVTCFAFELRHYFASLPFLDRLRLRHLTDWSQALKLPHSHP